MITFHGRHAQRPSSLTKRIGSRFSAVAGSDAMFQQLEGRRLLAGITFDEPPSDVVPGALYFMGATAGGNGLFELSVYLSQDRVLDSDDILVHHNILTTPRNELYSFAFEVDDRVAPGDYYFIGAASEFGQGTNVSSTHRPMRVHWSFGQVADGRNVTLKLRDGDSTVTFIRTGHGTGNVSKNSDGTFNISMEGTTAATDVQIKVSGGDGLTSIRNFSTDGPLGSLMMPSTSIHGSVNIAGSLDRIDARDVIGAPGVGASISITGPGDETYFRFRHVANASITSVNGIAELTLTSKWSDSDSIADVISASYLTSLEVHGNFAAGLRLLASRAPGNTPTLGNVGISGQAGTNAWRIVGGAGSIAAGSTSVSFSASFGGTVSSFATSQNFRGVLAAAKFHGISIGRTVDTGWFLAGANLGADGRLGGSGADADTFGPGQVWNVTVASRVLRGLFAAGLDLVDGVFDNANDRIRGGLGSKLGPLTVGGTTTSDSRFLAGQFVGAIRIDGASVFPQNDRRFVRNELGTPRVEWVGGNVASTSITFRFTDDQMLNLATIGNTDFKLAGPNGFASFLTLESALPTVNLASITLRFTVHPPGGSWDPSDNGTYRLGIYEGAFTDLIGNPVAGGRIARFILNF